MRSVFLFKVHFYVLCHVFRIVVDYFNVLDLIRQHVFLCSPPTRTLWNLIYFFFDFVITVYLWFYLFIFQVFCPPGTIKGVTVELHIIVAQRRQ